MNRSYVYVVAHVTDGRLTGPVKVGIADNPWSRVAGLQTGNPVELRIVHVFAAPSRKTARQIESAFHVIMAPERMMGEWFDLAPITAVGRVVHLLRYENDMSGGDDSAMVAMGVIAAEKLITGMLSPTSEAVQ